MNGSVQLSAGGVLFTPVPGFSGQASFDYVVSDGTFTDVGHATIAVAPAPNRPPRLADPIDDQSSPEDAAISFRIPAAAFLDPDGDTLLYSASIADDTPLPGWLSFDAGTQTFSGTPPEHFNGTIPLKLIASDGAESASDVFDLVIAPVNDPPSGADAIIVIDEDVARTLVRADFGFSDLTEEDGFAGIVITALPGDGALLLEGAPITLAGTFVTDARIAAGSLVFRPDGDENGALYATLGFRVRDSGGTDSGGQDTDPTENAIRFDVGAVNDGPENSVPGGQMLDEDGILAFGIATGNAIGVADLNSADGDITVTLAIADGALALSRTDDLAVTGNGGATVVLAGTIAAINAALDGLSYTPPANAHGPRLLSITTTDAGHEGAGGAMVDSDTVAIMVAPVDDAPVARPDAVATGEASVLNGSVLANDDDIDGPALSVAAVNGVAGDVGSQITLPSGALLTLETDGGFSYDPNGRFSALPGPASGATGLTGADGFTYTLANGNEVAVTVTISGVDSDGDILLGTPGADSLDGGAGADQAAGLDGDDLYLIDSPRDWIIEAPDSGSDTILSAVSYRLHDGADVETLSAIAPEALDPINLTGNILANRLTGNAGANQLDGKSGADAMAGGGGNDIYLVDLAADQAIEEAGAGYDVIYSAASYDAERPVRGRGPLDDHLGADRPDRPHRQRPRQLPDRQCRRQPARRRRRQRT